MEAIITKEDIKEFYNQGILKREGQFHAQLDNVKDVVMCKLAHMSPKILGSGRRIVVRDKLISRTMEAWMESNKDISSGLTGNTIEKMRIALRDIFIELLDERVFDILPHSNPRHRESRNPNIKDREYTRREMQNKYFGNLILEDFDIKRNEKIINGESLDYPDELIKEAQDILSEAIDEDMVVPNSPIQAVLFQQAIDLIENAKNLCEEE